MKGAGKAYVSDLANNQIDIYQPYALASPPTVTTDPATGVGLSTATLNATVNPRSSATSDCHFDYIDDATFVADSNSFGAGTQTAPCAPDPGSGGHGVAVHADLTGLPTGTTFHFRASATTGGGTTIGDADTFATTPIAFTDPAAASTTTPTPPSTATSTPTATPSPTASSTGAPPPLTETPPIAPRATPSPIPRSTVSAFINNLTPDTTIHYRLHLTTAANGEAFGTDHNFTPLRQDRPRPPRDRRLSRRGRRPALQQRRCRRRSATGDVFVADTGNNRVDKFDADGNFLRAWGWNVVASGPDNQAGVDDVQKISLYNATGGTFRLGFQTATGSGTVTKDSSTITNVNTGTGAFNVGDQISGGDVNLGIPSGATITAVGAGELTISAPAIGSMSAQPDTVSLTSVQLTSPMAFNASAADVQSGLEGLSILDPGDVGVTGSTGGPWTVEFTGSKGHLDIPGLTADYANLTGSGPSAAATTTQQGGAREVCVPANGDTCQAGTSGSSPGQFALPDRVAVDNSGGASQGDVYVFDASSRSITKFDPSGSLVSGWGTGGQIFLTLQVFKALAVDSSGRVYTFGDGSVKVYRYSGATGDQIDILSGGAQGVSSIAIEPSGSLLELNGLGAVERWNLSGQANLYVGKRDQQLASSNDIALDPSTGELYVASGAGYFGGVAQIRHYRFDPSGNVIQADFSACTPLFDLNNSHPDGGCDQTDSFGVGDLTNPLGIGVYAAARKVYVTDSGQLKIFTGVTLTPPTVTPQAFSALTGTSVTFHAKVDPENVQVSDCHFSYVDDAEFQANGYANAAQAPCDPNPGSGSGDVPVSADVTALDPATVYHFRIEAENATPRSAVTGPDQTLTTRGPIITHTHANPVTATDASLDATINPQGTPTTYHFDYGPTSDYGSSTTESGAIAGLTDHAVSDQIDGLAPGTTYHFRIVAKNADAAIQGPDATFTTAAAVDSCPNAALRAGHGFSLPDCRAYEQASPIDKHGANALTSVNFSRASADGSGVIFSSTAGLPTTGGESRPFPVLARRGADGWLTNGIVPLLLPGHSSRMGGMDSALTTSVSTDDTAGGFYIGDTAAGTWASPFSGPAGNFSVGVPAFSDDPAHFLVSSDKALTFGAIGGKPNLYDYDHGALSLAGRIPAFPATACNDQGGPACVAPANGAFAGSYYAADGALTFVSPKPTLNTISGDGSRIVFTESGTGRIYLRKGGVRTIQVSASQKTNGAGPGGIDANGHKPAAWVASSHDGSTIYFTSCEKLTNDSTAVSTGANAHPPAPSESGLRPLLLRRRQRPAHRPHRRLQRRPSRAPTSGGSSQPPTTAHTSTSPPTGASLRAPQPATANTRAPRPLAVEAASSI